MTTFGVPAGIETASGLDDEKMRHSRKKNVTIAKPNTATVLSCLRRCGEGREERAYGKE